MAAQTKTTQSATKSAAKAAASKTARSAAGQKKSPAKKAPAKTAAKAPAKTSAKTPTKAAPAKRTPAKRTPARSAAKAPARTAAGAASGRAGVGTAASARAGVGKASQKAPVAKNAPARSRLSAADVQEFTALIQGELARVRQEYEDSVAILDELKNAGQDSAGDDPADAGTKTFEREQEMSIANNRRDLITQMERAMVRIKAGTYGLCESCGQLIPKARLQAYPQATLCVACKAREERR